jgi:transposase
MQTLIERGCGLDVHQATVVACLLMVRRDGKVQKQMRTFGTTTRELVGLREWLLSQGCTHVAMESTGVYWKPIYAILEGGLEIVVANAQHIKKVPGRKTDVKDAEWIADLLCHGLLRSSFVPPKSIRELRDLMRYRRKLVESQAAERNRLLKVWETANIKLANVATDVFGMSGRLMLRALIAGKATPQELAELAKGASAATTRSGGKRPGSSGTTHPANARTLCCPAGLIGRDTRCGLDSGRSDHC